MENKLALSKKNIEVSEKLNGIVMELGSENIDGFQKAYMISEAINQLQSALTPEYMQPIMKLQGTRLGFKTDKDNESKQYSEFTVKKCLIEAVLIGVQPAGNQFNIIAGNCYITKEGFFHLLKNMSGLSYKITYDLPRINNDKTSAAIVANIKWVYNGIEGSESLDLPIRMNRAMGTDAVIGKAERKSRAWLYNHLNNSDISDGDVSENNTIHVKVNSETPNPFNKEEKPNTENNDSKSGELFPPADKE